MSLFSDTSPAILLGESVRLFSQTEDLPSQPPTTQTIPNHYQLPATLHIGGSMNELQEMQENVRYVVMSLEVCSACLRVYEMDGDSVDHRGLHICQVCVEKAWIKP